MTWTILPSPAFADHRRAWDALNAAGANSPLLHTDFIEPLLREFATGKERLAIYSPVGEPRAMALLVPAKPGVWETFQPSQLPVGPWLNPDGLPLVPLLKSLSSALPGFVLQLGLTQQDPDIQPRPADSDHVKTLDYIQTARIAINQPFEQYWSQRGKNLRHNLNRQANRLQRESIAVRLEAVTDPNQAAAAVRDYGILESAGWKAQGGTAIHEDNPQGRFYTAMLENFCQRGMGLIYRYYYDDRLVASDLCVQQGGTLVVLKTTYDETITTSSPAMLMRHAYLGDLFKHDSVKVIEFYGKVMEWHTRLTEDIRVLYHVNYFRWSLAEKLYKLIISYTNPYKSSY